MIAGLRDRLALPWQHTTIHNVHLSSNFLLQSSKNKKLPPTSQQKALTEAHMKSDAYLSLATCTVTPVGHSDCTYAVYTYMHICVLMYVYMCACHSLPLVRYVNVISPGDKAVQGKCMYIHPRARWQTQGEYPCHL